MCCGYRLLARLWPITQLAGLWPITRSERCHDKLRAMGSMPWAGMSPLNLIELGLVSAGEAQELHELETSAAVAQS